jgi:hypothetical protein
MRDLTTSSISTPPQLRPLPESWVVTLFEKMLLDYGKKFTDQWGGADSNALIAYWSASLAGFTGAELDRGVAAMDSQEWPPTLPQFKRMCRPPLDPMVAYYAAITGLQARQSGRMGVWPNPAVFWAAMALSADLNGQSYAVVRTRWEKTLEEWLQKGELDPIPEPLVALPAPGRTRLAVDEAQQRLSDLQASGVLKRAPAPGRNLAWAQKILDRETAGDLSVELYSLKLAKQALGLP